PTAGDLYWWLSHGIPAAGMPGFGARLTEDQRWDLINFLRALSAGYAARNMGKAVEPDRRWLVAPDFAFAVGPTPPRSLKEYRGRVVLLLLYQLPDSRARLRQLAARDAPRYRWRAGGLAVRTDAVREAIRPLGEAPRVLFHVVTDGAEPIVSTFRLFAPAPHAEFLIDRQGYVRAIAKSRGQAEDVEPLLGQIQELNQERVPVEAPPDEHVH